MNSRTIVLSLAMFACAVGLAQAATPAPHSTSAAKHKTTAKGHAAKSAMQHPKAPAMVRSSVHIMNQTPRP